MNAKRISFIFGKLFWLLFYFLTPIIPMFYIYNSNKLKFNMPHSFWGMVTGTCAFVWFVYEFALISRPKFIEKYYGLDKFYVFHGIMAFVSIILVFIHKQLLYENSLGDKSFKLYLIVIILASLFISNTFLTKIKPIAFLKNQLVKLNLFKYNNQVLIHNLALIAYIIMFMHVKATTALKRYPKTKFIFTTYFIIGLVFYVYHSFVKPILLYRNNYIVKEVTKESNNLWTLSLTPEKKKIFSYKPGQFAYIKLYGKKIKAETHPFSISSSPLNKEYISFTIKELGDFTNKISNANIGDKVAIDGPYGRFSYLNYPKEASTVLIAGGIGISPCLSMLRYMCENDPNHSVLLLWGINTKDDLICLEEFKSMEIKMKNFHFIPVMFRDDSWHGKKGIINKSLIKECMLEFNLDYKICGYYICGPEILTKTVVSSLKSLKVKKSKIHYEKFSM